MRVRVETVSCYIPSRVRVFAGLSVAGLSMQHRIVQSMGLHPLQFERQVNRLAASPHRGGTSMNVAPFACRDALVSLDGFDARISTCVRQYRLFAGLYDYDVTVVGIDDEQQALVSRLTLKGVGFESASGPWSVTWEPCVGRRDAGRADRPAWAQGPAAALRGRRHRVLRGP